MSDEFGTVENGASLRDAVGTMLRESLDHVVVVDDGSLVGMITDRRALAAAYKAERTLDEIPVGAVAAGFDVTVKPESTVLFAIGLMVKHGVKVLPVRRDFDIVGIVSRAAILENTSNLRSEAIEHAGG